MNQFNNWLIIFSIFVGACSGSVPPQSSKVSECGGFLKEKKTQALANSNQATDALSYCDAEVLKWTYDENTQTLAISNNRVILNCCGDRSIEAIKDNNKYTINEKDSGASGRCACSCPMGFQIEIKEVVKGGISLEIIREVIDYNQSKKSTPYNGTLDLNKNSDTIIIDNTSISDVMCE